MSQLEMPLGDSLQRLQTMGYSTTVYEPCVGLFKGVWYVFFVHRPGFVGIPRRIFTVPDSEVHLLVEAGIRTWLVPDDTAMASIIRQ